MSSHIHQNGNFAELQQQLDSLCSAVSTIGATVRQQRQVAQHHWQLLRATYDSVCDKAENGVVYDSFHIWIFRILTIPAGRPWNIDPNSSVMVNATTTTTTSVVSSASAATSTPTPAHRSSQSSQSFQSPQSPQAFYRQVLDSIFRHRYQTVLEKLDKNSRVYKCFDKVRTRLQLSDVAGFFVLGRIMARSITSLTPFLKKLDELILPLAKGEAKAHAIVDPDVALTLLRCLEAARLFHVAKQSRRTQKLAADRDHVYSVVAVNDGIQRFDRQLHQAEQSQSSNSQSVIQRLAQAPASRGPAPIPAPSPSPATPAQRPPGSQSTSLVQPPLRAQPPSRAQPPLPAPGSRLAQVQTPVLPSARAQSLEPMAESVNGNHCLANDDHPIDDNPIDDNYVEYEDYYSTSAVTDSDDDASSSIAVSTFMEMVTDDEEHAEDDKEDSEHGASVELPRLVSSPELRDERKVGDRLDNSILNLAHLFPTPVHNTHNNNNTHDDRNGINKPSMSDGDVGNVTNDVVFGSPSDSDDSNRESPTGKRKETAPLESTSPKRPRLGWISSLPDMTTSNFTNPVVDPTPSSSPANLNRIPDNSTTTEVDAESKHNQSPEPRLATTSGTTTAAPSVTNNKAITVQQNGVVNSHTSPDLSRLLSAVDSLQPDTWLNGIAIDVLISRFSSASDETADGGGYGSPTFGYLDTDLTEDALGPRHFLQDRHASRYAHWHSQARDYVFLPVNESASHWVLYLWDCLTRTLQRHDSLGYSLYNARTNDSILGLISWLYKDVSIVKQAKIEMVECPRQANSSDCGVHAIVNAHRLWKQYGGGCQGGSRDGGEDVGEKQILSHLIKPAPVSISGDLPFPEIRAMLAAQLLTGPHIVPPSILRHLDEPTRFTTGLFTAGKPNSGHFRDLGFTQVIRKFRQLMAVRLLDDDSPFRSDMESWHQSQFSLAVWARALATSQMRHYHLCRGLHQSKLEAKTCFEKTKVERQDLAKMKRDREILTRTRDELGASRQRQQQDDMIMMDVMDNVGFTTHFPGSPQTPLGIQALNGVKTNTPESQNGTGSIVAQRSRLFARLVKNIHSQIETALAAGMFLDDADAGEEQGADTDMMHQVKDRHEDARAQVIVSLITMRAMAKKYRHHECVIAQASVAKNKK